jgi:flagellar protein FlbD
MEPIGRLPDTGETPCPGYAGVWKEKRMIVLTKMNSDRFLVNHLQIECIELIPETKIVMMNRSYYLVRETAEEIVRKIAEYNAKVQDISRAVRVIGQR